MTEKRLYSYADAVTYIGAKRSFFDEYLISGDCGLLRNARAIANLQHRSRCAQILVFEER